MQDAVPVLTRTVFYTKNRAKNQGHKKHVNTLPVPRHGIICGELVNLNIRQSPYILIFNQLSRTHDHAIAFIDQLLSLIKTGP